MRDDLIFHLVPAADWKKFKDSGAYHPESLNEEGFIHCSAGRQVEKVANAHFQGRDDLLLLVIDPASLKPDVKYEASGASDEKYPHVYGPVNIDAVIDKIKLEPRENGSFFIQFDSSE